MTLASLTRDLAALRPGSETAFRVGSRRVIVRRRRDGRWDVLRRGGNLVTLCASTAGEAARHALGRARCDAETAAGLDGALGRPRFADAPLPRFAADSKRLRHARPADPDGVLRPLRRSRRWFA